jgi:hypothetical protein
MAHPGINTRMFLTGSLGSVRSIVQYSPLSKNKLGFNSTSALPASNCFMRATSCHKDKTPASQGGKKSLCEHFQTCSQGIAVAHIYATCCTCQACRRQLPDCFDTFMWNCGLWCGLNKTLPPVDMTFLCQNNISHAIAPQT